MTKSYAQIVKQIEVLKQDAEKARRKEAEGVIGRIREAITAYKLTAADLGFGVKPKTARKTRGLGKAKAGKAKAPRAPKFRDEAGHTWGGIGKRPDWLRAALAAGKSLSDFAIK
jgi:DNA-binding protein H-NS